MPRARSPLRKAQQCNAPGPAAVPIFNAATSTFNNFLSFFYFFLGYDLYFKRHNLYRPPDFKDGAGAADAEGVSRNLYLQRHNLYRQPDFLDGGRGCRGRVQQMGPPLEIENRPANPFVLNFLGEVNQIPSDCEFARRMGVITRKPSLMFRPTRIEVAQELPPTDGRPYAPATVVDRYDSGFHTKYLLRFDDGVVRNPLGLLPADQGFHPGVFRVFMAGVSH